MNRLIVYMNDTGFDAFGDRKTFVKISCDRGSLEPVRSLIRNGDRLLFVLHFNNIDHRPEGFFVAERSALSIGGIGRFFSYLLYYHVPTAAD